MEQELTALAEAGAVVVVSAMATDLWRSVREGTLAVFHRLGRERQRAVADQLESNAAMVRDAARPGEVRQALFGFWSLELAAVLGQDPEARTELARLIASFEALRTRRADTPVQTNTARAGGTVYAVQHGDQHITQPPH